MAEIDFDYQRQMADLISEADSVLEKLRSSGINVLLLTHSYDPMSNQTYTQWRKFGDEVALIGAVENFRRNWDHNVIWSCVDDEEEE